MSDIWKSKLHSDPVPWLLSTNPWTKYRTLIDLQEKPEESEELLSARDEMENHPQVQQLIRETENWFEELPKRHDDPKKSHYRLKMLADFGFTTRDQKVAGIIKKAEVHLDQNLYAIRQELPEKGSKKEDNKDDEWHALPCDSPVLTATLYRLGLRSEAMDKAVKTLIEGWQEESGWFCHLFFVNSQFKKHGAACMMAGLQMLELLSHLPEQDDKTLRNACASLEYHRDLGKSLYYFGRSKNFWTMKYPFVWYNALYLAEILTRFPQFKENELVRELIDWILESQDEDGRFKATSMFRPYKEWDFANKKETSPWITYLCCRILKRYFS